MIDCKMKCSSFTGSVNRVLANFGHLQSHILSQIFKTHCCTFHGSVLWYFNSEGFGKICTTWNKRCSHYSKAAHHGMVKFGGSNYRTL